MTCPSCDGKKKIYVHVNRGSQPHEWRWMDCHRCAGTGEVTDDVAVWVAKGEAMRADRLARGLSQKGYSEIRVESRAAQSK